METIKIEILNPKVKGILKQLAELKLIAIRSNPSKKEILSDLLEKFRTIDPDGLSAEDIVAETEIVRSKRNAQKKND